jgi:hypothetical protein
MPQVQLVSASNHLNGPNWTITKNLVDATEPDCKIGRKPRPSESLPFQLLDDDEEVYFEGLMLPTQSEALFQPLDDLGEGYGCTTMKIYEGEEWTVV